MQQLKLTPASKVVSFEITNNYFIHISVSGYFVDKQLHTYLVLEIPRRPVKRISNIYSCPIKLQRRQNVALNCPDNVELTCLSDWGYVI